MSLGRLVAVFLMHIPTSRCKCSTRVTKRIVPANQEILAKKIVLIDHEADRVGVAVAVVVGERRMIVHQRVGQKGRAPRQRSDEPRVEHSQPELEDEFSDEELMEDHDDEISLDDGDDDGDDSNGVATGAGISRSAALQRSIPSWDEAIGFIVDANMQSRSQRRPPSRSGGGGSRDNGSRGGRGRGRRRS